MHRDHTFCFPDVLDKHDEKCASSLLHSLLRIDSKLIYVPTLLAHSEIVISKLALAPTSHPNYS
jgi:hypothetical protein